MSADTHPLRGTVLRALQVAPRNSAELPPMQPYRSPAVVRRPGSDHSAIPSLAGGRLIRRSA